MLAFLAVGSHDLDGEHTRHKILMADGVLFNFSTGELRKARMSDRMTRRAAATSEEWSSAPAAVAIGQKIYHFFFRDPNGYMLEIQRFENPNWPGN